MIGGYLRMKVEKKGRKALEGKKRLKREKKEGKGRRQRESQGSVQPWLSQ